MSSFFFHLKLELYSTPAENKRRKLQHHHHHRRSDIFTPPSGADIFKTDFPAHRKGQWTSYSFSKRYRESIAEPTTPLGHISGSDRSRSPHQPLSPPSGNHESHGDALLLPERSLRLRKEAPPSPRLHSTARHSNQAAARDWRYDAVEIESIDMEISKAKSTANGGLHTKAVYIPSEPKTTDVGFGVVHLYRDAEESSALDETAVPRKSLDRIAKTVDDGSDTFSRDDCTTLCILAVPSWMMPSDLLGFVGDQAREDVSHFRLIRTGRANKYMVLLKFRSAKKARDWQKLWNGRLFSAAEPENCHVVFIKSVEFLSPGPDVVAGSKFPHNTNDPFTAVASTNGSGKGMLSKPLAPPPPNLLELPTCPVCLERMDETTGLLTILCQHVFHCACLEKWRGSGCPVCRYTHSPSYTFPYPRPTDDVDGEREDADPLCSTCAGTDNLWVCLICGNIGCGRYDEAHAYAHYEATSHCYAMDINTQHVWDYAGDGYVHRLIQSKPAPESSGRSMIDLPTRQRHENEAFRAEGGDSVPREKMESMASEYTYLLTSQLEGQRRYFEEQVERAVDKASRASARAEEAAASASKAFAQLEEARSDRQTMSETLARVEKALEKSEKTRGKFEQMARDMSSQLREEKTMNEGLLQRIKAADQQAEEAKHAAAKAVEEKKELEEMNHDLSMFISSSQKVQELQAAGEEVVDGSVSVPDPPPAKKGKGKGRKK
ncbi:RING finger protein ETP1 [Fulvia fulva]|uniref:RING finger protein ETP1 n=1 Tax=Passalora fulva TaxID=5499 RepID=A0A9Q8LIS0_PASFU|nr:RING finger protein ETP1 [Fulvia fulva]KAK4624290.1 RING finger protein ETP1 [Fulvia fulva]KAK4624916.1 RING finger protein ETP1 [Fulvia fulva]UJO17889.1 RING finger protein ETP1 [Fulvia fulva]WPV15264.1 RING finger protein ETP1 [Fulvia fulva]WPV30456.1 RING finger protein ETP1 [Fulvia fulva]